MTLPPSTARLFAHEDQQLLLAPSGRGLLIARLLEEGDGEDLRWLLAEVPESELRAWVARHGGRKLSRRSRAFWADVLGTPAGEPAAFAAAVWPL
jgi:hypothetical protein